jgi:signal transduction histidine kinase
MNRTIAAHLARPLLVSIYVGAVLIFVVRGGGVLLRSSPVLRPFVVLLPFVAATVCVVGLGVTRPRIDRLIGQLTHHREVSPYSALAAAATQMRAASLEQALPGLAKVLADGTGANRTAVWLAVGDQLHSAAAQPPRDTGPPTIENLAVLLDRTGTGCVVPVLEGTVLRAALAIEKPDAGITPEDHRLVQDMANGAGLLLRCVALNAEVAERIRRVESLAAELEASRQRLARVREVERRRLIMELGSATTDRLAALRTEVRAARADLDPGRVRADRVQDALERARSGLDELTDRFRVIARGVYPAVLRDQGPVAALDELAADLPRPVRLTGELGRRLAWEIESGIYYVAACAVQQLAGRPAECELLVHFERTPGRLSVQIEDAAPAVAAEQLRDALASDAERVAALGGDLDLTDEPAVGPEGAAGEPGSDIASPRGTAPGRTVTVRAWLPDRLEPPLVESSAVVAEVR